MVTINEVIGKEENSYPVTMRFNVDEYVVDILISDQDGILLEGSVKNLDFGGQYYAQLHSAHSNPGQKHIHVYAKNRQLFSMNIDGSAHDRSHGARIPNKVADAIRNILPGFKIPENNLI